MQKSFALAMLTVAAVATPSLKETIDMAVSTGADVGAAMNTFMEDFAGVNDEKLTSAPIHVSRTQFTSDNYFNYPDIIVAGYGTKSNVSAQLNLLYSEPVASFSAFELKPSVNAFATMWNSVLIGGIYELYWFFNVTFLEIVPINLYGSFPNYLASFDSKPITDNAGANTCFKLQTTMKFINVQFQMDTNAIKIYSSLTQWFAEDMESDLVHYGFDEQYAATGGWVDFGSLWSGSWTHVNACATVAAAATTPVV